MERNHLYIGDIYRWAWVFELRLDSYQSGYRCAIWLKTTVAAIKPLFSNSLNVWPVRDEDKAMGWQEEPCPQNAFFSNAWIESDETEKSTRITPLMKQRVGQIKRYFHFSADDANFMDHKEVQKLNELKKIQANEKTTEETTTRRTRNPKFSVGNKNELIIYSARR